MTQALQAKTIKLAKLVGELGKVGEPQYPSAWGIAPYVAVTDAHYLAVKRIVGPCTEIRKAGRMILSPFNFQTIKKDEVT